MKAAYGSPSARRHHDNFSNGTYCGTSVNVSTVTTTSSTRSSPTLRMVMPPFIRLDSTGESSTEDGPSIQSGHKRTNNYPCHRQGASAIVGKMFQLPPQSANLSSRQFTSQKMAQGGISALDELVNNSQSVPTGVKHVFPPTMKASQVQRPSRYGQWPGVSMVHTYPCSLPLGVFPCHVFKAMQSVSHVWPPSGGGYSKFVHKANSTTWSSRESLLSTCQQFVPRNNHHQQPDTTPKQQSGTTIVQSSCSESMHDKVDSIKSESDVQSSIESIDLIDDTSEDESDCVVRRSSSSTSERESQREIETPAPASWNSSNLPPSAHSRGAGENQSSAEPEESATLVSDSVKVSDSVYGCVEGTAEKRIMAACLSPLDFLVNGTGSDILTTVNHLKIYSSNPKETRAQPKSSQTQNGCVVARVARSAAAVDHKLSPETKKSESDSKTATGTISMRVPFVGGGETSESDSTNHLNVTAAISARAPVTLAQNVHLQEEIDWDSDESVDWSDEDDEVVDEASQADAMSCFLFMPTAVLCRPKLSCQEEDEEEKEEEREKSPPKPDVAANRRWDQHHPASVPTDRAIKVRFTCGQEVDSVLLFERETFTMMEIQKLRDISKQNEGKAAHILRTKSNDQESRDEDSEISHTTESDIIDLAGADASGLKKGVRMGGHEKEAVVVNGNDLQTDGGDDSEDDDDFVVSFHSQGSVASTESEKEDEGESDEEEEVEEEEDDVVFACDE